MGVASVGETHCVIRRLALSQLEIEWEHVAGVLFILTCAMIPDINGGQWELVCTWLCVGC